MGALYSDQIVNTLTTIRADLRLADNIPYKLNSTVGNIEGDASG